MVRLGGGCPVCALHWCISFQFQYSAIRSQGIGNAASSYMLGFNSSMVRLGDSNNPNAVGTIVRFNSSMVRLGGLIHNRNGAVYATFQFQYGAIRSALLREPAR